MDVAYSDSSSATTAVASGNWRMWRQAAVGPLLGGLFLSQAVLGQPPDVIGRLPGVRADDISTSAAAPDWSRVADGSRASSPRSLGVQKGHDLPLPTSAVTSAAVPHTYITPSLEQLHELSLLDQDWDYYGSPPPTPASIAVARRFLEEFQTQFGPVAHERVQPFHIAPIPGGVQLEWVAPGRELTLVVGAGGELSFLQVCGEADDRDYTEMHAVAWSDAMLHAARNVVPRLLPSA